MLLIGKNTKAKAFKDLPKEKKQEIAIEVIKQLIDPEECLKRLESNKDKIKFLRYVQGYTQEEVSEKVFLSVRQVQRIEKEIKEELVLYF